MNFLDSQAKKSFDAVVEKIEATSSVEAVIAIRGRSASYYHVHAVAAVLCVFGVLAYTLFAEQVFSLIWIILLPFMAGVGGAVFVESVPGARRVGTSERQRQHATQRAARATFVELGVHHTTSRCGVLFYYSLLERKCSVIADLGVVVAVPAAELAALEVQLGVAISAGGVATARAMEHVLPLLKMLPRSAVDRNELPDALNVQVSRLPIRARLFGGRV